MGGALASVAAGVHADMVSTAFLMDPVDWDYMSNRVSASYLSRQVIIVLLLCLHVFMVLLLADVKCNMCWRHANPYLLISNTLECTSCTANVASHILLCGRNSSELVLQLAGSRPLPVSHKPKCVALLFNTLLIVCEHMLGGWEVHSVKCSKKVGHKKCPHPRICFADICFDLHAGTTSRWQ